MDAAPWHAIPSFGAGSGAAAIVGRARTRFREDSRRDCLRHGELITSQDVSGGLRWQDRGKDFQGSQQTDPRRDAVAVQSGERPLES